MFAFTIELLFYIKSRDHYDNRIKCIFWVYPENLFLDCTYSDATGANMIKTFQLAKNYPPKCGKQ